MAESVITISKVRDVISAAGMRTDSALPDELNQRVLTLISGAIQRARDNGRSTVRADDLAGQRAFDPVGVTLAGRVQAVIRAAGVRVGGNLVDALNGHVHAILTEGIEKARANGRSTVRPHDLPSIR